MCVCVNCTDSLETISYFEVRNDFSKRQAPFSISEIVSSVSVQLRHILINCSLIKAVHKLLPNKKNLFHVG